MKKGTKKSKIEEKLNIEETEKQLEDQDDSLEIAEAGLDATTGAESEASSDYSSDDSEDELNRNTIGNVPMHWYDDAEHVGYDAQGKRIAKLLKSSELESLLRASDDPDAWRTITDVKNQRSVVLTDADVSLIKKLKSGITPSSNAAFGISAETAQVDFTTDHSVHPSVYRDPSKKHFLSARLGLSADELRQVKRLLKLVRAGKFVTRQPKKTTDGGLEDLWSGEGATRTTRGPRPVPAPKMELPSHAESYNPPEEYLMDEEERKKWEAGDWSTREKNFLPAKFSCMRHVPFYARALNERYERCLDLFTLPRRFKKKMNVDVDSLKNIQLPDLNDLKPFPTFLAAEFNAASAAESRSSAVSGHPSGEYVVVGSGQSVTVFDVLTTCPVWSVVFEVAVSAVAWNPKESGLLAVGCEDGSIQLVELPEVLGSVEGGAKEGSEGWQKNKKMANTTVAIPGNGSTVSRLVWHNKGRYLASVHRETTSLSESLFIHSLNNSKTMKPLSNKNSNGKIVDVTFHPTRASLVVTSQRAVRILDLKQQITEKTLTAGNSAKTLIAAAVHPSGDHVVAVSEDKRLIWWDLDLGVKPWRVLKNFHDKGMRSVVFHKKLPLLATASDDGTVQVFHARVSDDLNKQPTLVPVKKLHAGDSACVSLHFHSHLPWLFSTTASDDAVCKLWVA